MSQAIHMRELIALRKPDDPPLRALAIRLALLAIVERERTVYPRRPVAS